MDEVSAWVQKELLKLTTAQLVKLCKSQNVSFRGKKSELVSRLITKKQKALMKQRDSKLKLNPKSKSAIKPRSRLQSPTKMKNKSRSRSASPSKRKKRNKTSSKLKSKHTLKPNKIYSHSHSKLPSPSKRTSRSKKKSKSHRMLHHNDPSKSSSKTMMPIKSNTMNSKSKSKTSKHLKIPSLPSSVTDIATLKLSKIREESPPLIPSEIGTDIDIPSETETKSDFETMDSVDISDLSIEDSMNNLFNGYIRMNYKMIHLYPTQLITMIYTFCGNVITRFDSYSPKYKNTIFKNGFMIRRKEQNYYKNDGKYKKLNPSVYLIGCSNGYNYGTHSWEVRVHQSCNDYIGIISDIDVTKKKIIGLYAAPTNSYYYSIKKSVICCGKNADIKFKSVRCQKQKWKNSDFWVTNQDENVLRVELDCNLWSVKFYKDEALLGREMFITPEKTYYLAIESRCDHTMYTLLQ